ncbi:lycopene cyclase family protein [Streptomyces sp. NPDC050560]|uniref:lycopene cyclase family protein n=1 Tax=Streptomyces sp. NPDC050560 TaxID=3365630 RepID=UPI0037B5EE10
MRRRNGRGDAVGDADVVVVGAGAAGLSLARRLAATRGPGGRVPSIVVVEPPPGAATSPPRTWCFWERAAGDLDAFVSASWERLCVRDPGGRTLTGTTPYPYRMIRSADYLPAVARELASAAHVRRLTGTVTRVAELPCGGRVTGVDAHGAAFAVEGRWVFDSRPPRRLPPARTTLFQHFRGWFVETAADRFEPGVAELMDFRTPQPARGLSFAYVLPFSKRRALVEYTEFSPRPSDRAAHERALDHYTRHIRPLGAFTVTAAEQGAIPMTDAQLSRGQGASVFAIGTAGGATRPATGYTFATVQRQSAAIADAWRRGHRPVPPRPHKRRHLAMDAAWLRALDRGRIDGPAFFTGLFAHNPLPRVLRFLDGASTPAEDIALGLRCPAGAMALSLLELPLLPRRSTPLAPAGARTGPSEKSVP